AEDGIRDRNVTGVQTCALPISATEAIDALSAEVEADLDEVAGGIYWWNGHVGWMVSAQLGEYLLASCTGVGTSLRNASLAVDERSEERRVGRECKGQCRDEHG